MTQDLKLTVYGLATDGNTGTQMQFFNTKQDCDNAIWRMITPKTEWPNGGNTPVDVDASEYRARFGNDWSNAWDHWMPEYLTFQTDHITIDLSTVPAVAALVERVKVLEDFRAKVANTGSMRDIMGDDAPEDGADIAGAFYQWSEEEPLINDLLTFDSYILEARALALPDAAKEGGAA